MARLQCCQSEITRVIPAGSTEAEIEAVVNQMFVECAQQQALCDAETEFPTSPVVFGNVVVYFSMDCAVDTTITFSGSLPSGVSLDTAGSRVVLAAGVIAGFTQAEVDAAAQSFLNGFCEAAIIAGTLTCEAITTECAEFENFSWDAGTQDNQQTGAVGAGSSSGTCLENNFSLTATSQAFACFGCLSQGQITFVGQFNYTGGPLDCCISIDFTGSPPNGAPTFQQSSDLRLTLTQDGNPVISTVFVEGDGTTQNLSYPFTLADSPVPSLIEVTVRARAQGIDDGIGSPQIAGSSIIVGTFGACP